MAWLGEELPANDQDGRTPFAPRCIKDVVEERLFAARRDLFSGLDLVFIALSDQVKCFATSFHNWLTNRSTSLVIAYAAA
jgi:hypothetical protein